MEGNQEARAFQEKRLRGGITEQKPQLSHKIILP